MVGTTAALIGLAIAGTQAATTVYQTKAANNVAKTQADAEKYKFDAQRAMWGQTQAAMAPYAQTGLMANAQMQRILSNPPAPYPNFQPPSPGPGQFPSYQGYPQSNPWATMMQPQNGAPGNFNGFPNGGR